jgi:glyceraldehyde-3-phosphate dehydrogenase (NADP+)
MTSEHPYWVAGQWKTSDSPWPVLNPYNNETVGITWMASDADVELALTAATNAFKETRVAPAHRRASFLFQISNGLKARSEEIARMIALEAGKPIGDARTEVQRAANTFQVAGEEAKRTPGELLPLDLMPGSDGRIGLTRRMPIGPILGIAPFNFPLNLVAHKIAPALAAGNTIILKPAPKTPLTALLLAEVIAKAEVPEGAVNLFLCGNDQTAKILTDPRIVMLTFTGSAPVGWRLKEMATKKRVLLELGGNAGVIIQPDADLDYAARRCAMGGFAYSGQVCISVQRIYVHEQVYDPFVSRFLPQVTSLKSGDPLDETTFIGPMIGLQAASRVEGWIKEAVAAGGRLLCGGGRSGNFVAPTVLADTTPAMNVNLQEVFAPIVTVTPYRHLDEAIAKVNDSPYGLQTGLFARDIQDIFHAFHRLDVGGLIVNDVPTYRIDHMPYGGTKESGVGREGLRYAIEEMTELKLMALNLSR